jgi:NADH-quinone oxidoreductase subunit M
MAMEWAFLLPVLVGLPLAAALAVALLGPSRAGAARAGTLAVTLVNLGLTAVVVAAFVWGSAPESAGETFSPRLTTRVPVLRMGTASDSPAVQFFVGVDGLNIWLLALTAVLTVPAVLASWKVSERANEYFAWLLVLLGGMNGVFVAFDVILFYVFFELTLVPLFFLVGGWGGNARREAARKLFLYTLAGSLLTLVGVLAVVVYSADSAGKPLTFAIPEVVRNMEARSAQLSDDLVQRQKTLVNATKGAEKIAAKRAWEDKLPEWETFRWFQFGVFLLLVAGFAVKTPLVPLHTWLPSAYTEAPLPTTFLLAGVLAKMGTYGLLRLAVPMLPDASVLYGPALLGILGAVGIVYGALCAFAQTDLKRLVAYSSLSHMGFVVVGLFALNQAGLSGSLMQMVNHGLTTGALFLLVGMLADRYGTRDSAAYSGLMGKLPLLTFLMVVACLASVGLPGLNSFPAEMLMMAGVVKLGTGLGYFLAAAGALGIVLGAWYLFTMLKQVFFGPLREPDPTPSVVEPIAMPAGDLTGRELAMVLPLVALCLVLGLFPNVVLRTAEPDVKVVSGLTERARARLTATAESVREADKAMADGGGAPVALGTQAP